MSSVLLSIRSSARTAVKAPLISNVQTSTKRWGHTVRLIALEDLPHNKGYERDVVTVKAGYARNFLIPKKKAVYATSQNFEKLGLVDPDVETEEQRVARMQRESSMSEKEDLHLKQADMLRKYLRNKVVSSFSLKVFCFRLFSWLTLVRSTLFLVEIMACCRSEFS